MPDMPPPLLTPAHRQRRQLLKGTVGTLLAAVAGWFGWTKYLFPPARKGAALGATSQFAENAAPTFVTPPGMDVTYAVQNVGGGNYHVLNATCTHQGCVVGWDKDAGQFLCPCHSARFSPDGSVVKGPAKRPLANAEVTREGNNLFLVDG